MSPRSAKSAEKSAGAHLRTTLSCLLAAILLIEGAIDLGSVMKTTLKCPAGSINESDGMFYSDGLESGAQIDIGNPPFVTEVSALSLSMESNPVSNRSNQIFIQESTPMSNPISNPPSNPLSKPLVPTQLVDGLTMDEAHQWILQGVMGEEQNLEYTRKREEEFEKLLRETEERFQNFRNSVNQVDDKIVEGIGLTNAIKEHLMLTKVEFEACSSRVPEAARPVFLSLVSSNLNSGLLSNHNESSRSSSSDGSSSDRSGTGSSSGKNPEDDNIQSDDVKVDDFVATVHHDYLARAEKMAQDKLETSLEELEEEVEMHADRCQKQTSQNQGAYRSLNDCVANPEVVFSLVPIMPAPELRSVLLNAKNHWNLLVKSYVSIRLRELSDAHASYLPENQVQPQENDLGENPELRETMKKLTQHRAQVWKVLFGEYKSRSEEWEKTCRGAQSDLETKLLEETLEASRDGQIYASDRRRASIRALGTDPRCPDLEKLAGRMHMVLPHDTSITPEMTSQLIEAYKDRALLDAFLQKVEAEGLGQFTHAPAGDDNLVGKCWQELLQFQGAIPKW